MPRLARLDAPGVLHHVMGQGIERRKIFQSDTDRNDFIDRLSALARDGALEIYAWVFWRCKVSAILKSFFTSVVGFIK
jgi:putative transposase